MEEASKIKLDVRVQSLEHLQSLLKRDLYEYRLEAEVGRESRSIKLYFQYRKLAPGCTLQLDDPNALTDNFGYDICIRILNDPAKYMAKVFCLVDWSAHDVAEETAQWGQKF